MDHWIQSVRLGLQFGVSGRKANILTTQYFMFLSFSISVLYKTKRNNRNSHYYDLAILSTKCCIKQKCGLGALISRQEIWFSYLKDKHKEL